MKTNNAEIPSSGNHLYEYITTKIKAANRGSEIYQPHNHRGEGYGMHHFEGNPSEKIIDLINNANFEELLKVLVGLSNECVYYLKHKSVNNQNLLYLASNKFNGLLSEKSNLDLLLSDKNGIFYFLNALQNGLNGNDEVFINAVRQIISNKDLFEKGDKFIGNPLSGLGIIKCNEATKLFHAAQVEYHRNEENIERLSDKLSGEARKLLGIEQ